MALTRDVVIRLLGDSASAVKATKAAADAAGVAVAQYRQAEREQQRQAAAAEAAAQRQRDAMDKLGKGMLTFGAVAAVGLGLAVKAAIDWESAWAGVTKTVDGTPAQMDELEKSLRNLATVLPATHEEIAGVAEAAGQLGVARGDIVEFTKVAIAMGVSTNLSADEAATAMARFQNIMGGTMKDAGRLGSAIVALGNAGASTEQEILDMSLRLGAAGRQAGMTEGEVLGLANAMSSVGIEAEAGGTAMSLVLKSINSAVLDGGDQLKKYADLAGMTTQQFAKAWRGNAAGALVEVEKGLHRVQTAGGNVNTVISDLGLDGIRTSDTLLRLSGNADGLAASLALGNKAWAENNALMNEANKRYETNASKIAMARNQISDAAIDIGGLLLPALAAGAEVVADFTRGFSDLPGPLKDCIAVLGILAVGVGLVGGAAIIAVPKIAAFRTEMALLAASSGTFGSAMGRFGTAMTGPWGAAIAGVVGLLGGLVAMLGASSRASKDAEDYTKRLADALRETNGAIDENVRAIAAQEAADRKIGDSNMLTVAKRLGIELPTLTDALLGNADAYDEIKTKLNGIIDASLSFEHAGDAGWTKKGEQARLLLAALDDLSPSLGQAVVDNQLVDEAQAKTGGSAKTTAGSLDSLADSTIGVGDAMGHTQTKAEDLADALDGLNGPTLDLRAAQRDWLQSIQNAQDALKENGKTLDVNTEKGRKNAAALDDMAKAAMDNANAIAANGGSYEQFHNSLDASRRQLIETAKSMGMTQEEAQALADQILQIPDAATVDIDLPTYEAVAGELDSVLKKVTGLPPNTTLNVGVLSAEAMKLLTSLGIKVETLPDGTVNVTTSGTGEAERQLAYLARTRQATIIAHAIGAGNMSADAAERAIEGRLATGGRFGGEPFARAVGGGDRSGLTLVGERGPELVRFGGTGYVTPADLTARALVAAQHAVSSFRPQTWLPALPGSAGVGGGGSVTNQYRTFAPVFQMTAARPVTAREAMDVARDYEWLHGG